MKPKSKTIPASKCVECGNPYTPAGRGRKFCGETCKSRHNVQRVINRLNSTTFTIAEAAGYYGCSLSTIRNRIQRRNIETFTIGRQIRIRQSDTVRLFD